MNLETLSQIGSIVGAFCSVLGLGAIAYSGTKIYKKVSKNNINIKDARFDGSPVFLNKAINPVINNNYFSKDGANE